MWAGGGGGKDEAAEDLIAMGVSPEEAYAFAPKEEEPVIEVWPENWQAVQVFIACHSQWRWLVGATALRIGLEYSGLQATMRMMGIAEKEWPDVFDRVRVMEAEALRVWNG